MATYRTIRMDFWNDPYVEGMEPQDKLLYVYLFSSPHTNNLGVLTVSRRKIAFETGLTEEGVAAGLAALERDGKVLIDGGAIWVAPSSFCRSGHCSRPCPPALSGGPFATATRIFLRLRIRYPYPPGNRKRNRKGKKKIGSGRTDFLSLWRCWKTCSATSRTLTYRPR